MCFSGLNLYDIGIQICIVLIFYCKYAQFTEGKKRKTETQGLKGALFYSLFLKSKRPIEMVDISYWRQS